MTVQQGWSWRRRSLLPAQRRVKPFGDPPLPQILDRLHATTIRFREVGIRPASTIGIRLQFAANAESLLTVLHGLEYGRPVAVVENVFIHASTAQAVGNEKSLSVRLDIFSFLQPGA